MRLNIAAIGKLKDDGETSLVARYRDRIQAIGPGIGFQKFDINEFPESRKGSVEERKAEEALSLLKGHQPSDALVALDEKGQALTSLAFASKLAAMRDDGIAATRFVIGGPDGLLKDMRGQAALVLSLSAMTLPHGLARVVLIEQIYRAFTISAGHPYHRP